MPRKATHFDAGTQGLSPVWLPLLLLAGLWIDLISVAGARAADVILNEYNAVGDTQFLANDQTDPFWGRVLGNGGDWFEMVVITDHLDMRGWELEIQDNSPDGVLKLYLTSDPVWADLRSGTIITVSEDLENNVDDYQPVLGQWWLNVKAANSANGRYITNSNFRVNNDNWRLTIDDDLDQVVFGPAGEGVEPISGVGSNEVCKLEENPSASITPHSGYRDGGSSTFGLPNKWNGGANEQDFSALRSVLPYHPLAGIRINEVLTHTDAPLEDFVELANTTDQNIDIGGWYLSDSLNVFSKFQIPVGVSIPAHGYVVFYASQLGFALNAVSGDDVVLSEADSSGVMTGGRDYVKFGAAAYGVSFGRFPDGDGELFRMQARTPGAANSSPLVGPVVLNEFMYHPPDLVGGVDNVRDEYIELHNVTDAPVALDKHFPDAGVTHPWKLSDGVEFVFPLGITIAPREFVLVVSFDPVLDAGNLTEFRAQYGLDSIVQIVGPYIGSLSNGGETVRLLQPDTPQPPPEALVPYLLVDEIQYSDRAPWPVEPDGQGRSLERIDPAYVVNDAVDWTASGASGGTPGCPNDQEAFVPGDVNGDGHADAADVAMFAGMLLGQPATSCRMERVDLKPDGVVNGLDVGPFTTAITP